MLDQEYGINKLNVSSSVNSVELHLPSFATDHERNTINNAVVCMSFLLKKGFTSFSEFVEKIHAHYDVSDNPRMKETIRVLISMSST
ncbi:hypothetical protein F7U66_01935 [Vibrio parahaemolyticus]|nr:hypothetical protein [Vibrio parahaemolyticus]